MRRKARRGGGRQVELTVTRLGSRGDGVSELEGRPVFLPNALAGERVLARLTGERGGGLKGEVLELLEPAAGRTDPPCPHYGPCGGCSVQHLEEDLYRAWKREIVTVALRRQGLPVETVQPVRFVPPGTRRRAVLAARQSRAGLELGYHERESHSIVDISRCLLLEPGLMELARAIRAPLARILGEGDEADITMVASESGPDVLLSGKRPPDLDARETLARFAYEADLARLSWSTFGEAMPPEPVAIRRRPIVHFGRTAVEPPPGSFLQPTAEGEAALVEWILELLPGNARTVADLYSGCGTFSFALARRSRVRAVEGDGPAVEALRAAAGRAGLSDRVTATVRDLVRRPMLAAELEECEAVIFDPPRAGARAQAEELARSTVGSVIGVSCNPATFARDARRLVDGGYELVEVRPLDQFPWSGHMELVALLRR